MIYRLVLPRVAMVAMNVEDIASYNSKTVQDRRIVSIKVD